jgi:5-methylcytosine-specific restriction endonuclease McrA
MPFPKGPIEEPPEFRRLRLRYEGLQEPHRKAIQSLADARQEVLKESGYLASLDSMDKQSTRAGWCFAVVGAILGASALSVVGLFLGAWLGLVAKAIVWSLAEGTRRAQEQHALNAASGFLAPYVRSAENARREIGELEARYRREYECLCAMHSGYPPDWDSRRQTVRERDEGRCVKCGWPDGFQVRRRELHTHHVVALSDGGDNSLDNLITLCHICHRSVDAKHRGVHVLNKPTDRRRQK